MDTLADTVAVFCIMLVIALGFRALTLAWDDEPGAGECWWETDDA